MKISVPPDKSFFIIIIFFLSILFIFRQTFHFDFINFDDELYVVKNPHLLLGMTKQGLLWAASSFYAANWHPLTLTSFLLDFELYGLNPSGYHLTNVAIHLFGGIFLFLAFREMTGDKWKSAIIASIFLFHPLHVEPVASVAGRKDVLSGLFFALTLLAYGRYAKKPALAGYLLTSSFFILGLMSKPTIITLPVILLLLDDWPLDRFDRSQTPFFRLLLEKLPLLLFSMTVALLTWIAQSDSAAIVPLFELDVASHLGNVSRSFILYLSKTIWPVDLSFFYPYTQGEVAGWFLPAFLLFSAVSFLGWHLRKSAPWLPVGWFWFIITMLPTLGIIQAGSQAMADRYTYIPLTGLGIISVWGSTPLLKKRNGGKMYALLWLAILALLALDSHHQATYWQNSRTLFEHALATTEGNYLAHNNLGIFHLRQEQYPEAERHFRKALGIKPDYTDAGNNLGQSMEIKGDYRKAEDSYRTVLGFHHHNSSARRRLCDLLLKTGRNEDAVSCYHEALRVNPDNPELHNNLAVALAAEDRPDEARSHLEKALRLQPDYGDAQRNLSRLNDQSAPGKDRRQPPPTDSKLPAKN